MRERVRKGGFRRACRDKRRKQVLTALKKSTGISDVGGEWS